MSDDWSLKGAKEAGRTPNNPFSPSEKYYYYREHVIETLRKKLIEDFENELEKANSSLDRERYYNFDKAIRIVNRRFGVDE